MRNPSIIGIVYLIVGLIVANNRGYFLDLTTLPHILSAILAVFLWPLLLVGVSLHLAALLP